jgi:hypothetical protein
MTNTRTRPTREEWEAEQRRIAESMIEHGHSHRDDNDPGPTSTFAQSDEIERLRPGIIKTVRAACGRIERQLRREHPDAAELAKPKGYSHERYEALSPAAHDALDDIWSLRRVRDRLSNSGWYANEFLIGWDSDWPSRYDRPTSPEIKRFLKVRAQTVAQWREKNRERGRRILAGLDSGVGWQRELESRVHVEEFLARGPVVHVIRPTIND